jgi:hypothetical protein
MRMGRIWPIILAILCAVEIWAHSGSRNGFLESSRPLYSAYGPPAASASEGYVTWIDTVPVLLDSVSFLLLVSTFLGEQGPENTGILDHRAAYAYLASLMVPWAGPYAGFMVVNFLFWWGASLAMWWMVRRRWNDTPLAYAASFLVATGNGFLFMAGLPMSYLAAYASMVLLLALAEWLGAFDRPRLSSWLILGWGAGIASVLYFAHIPTAIFWWLYGMRRVPWRYLILATVVTFTVSLSWQVFGGRVVGFGFATDNTSVLTDAVRGWVSHLGEPLPQLLTYFRAASVARTLIGAFPLPWWILAAIGFVVSSRADREWALAIFMAGLIPAIMLLSLLPLSRAAFYMYPAVYLLAARGALTVAMLASAWLARKSGQSLLAQTPWTPRVASIGATVVIVATLGGLALVSNVDLVGYHHFTARFHFTPSIAW